MSRILRVTILPYDGALNPTASKNWIGPGGRPACPPPELAPRTPDLSKRWFRVRRAPWPTTKAAAQICPRTNVKLVSAPVGKRLGENGHPQMRPTPKEQHAADRTRTTVKHSLKRGLQETDRSAGES